MGRFDRIAIWFFKFPNNIFFPDMCLQCGLNRATYRFLHNTQEGIAITVFVLYCSFRLGHFPFKNIIKTKVSLYHKIFFGKNLEKNVCVSISTCIIWKSFAIKLFFFVNIFCIFKRTNFLLKMLASAHLSLVTFPLKESFLKNLSCCNLHLFKNLIYFQMKFILITNKKNLKNSL